MPEFYVYGLIDRRTQSLFYIGKGKGKRMFQHLNEKEEIHSNLEKLEIINEIQQEGLEVDYILIGENLTEDSAFLLERLLIYRLGRKIFDEGCLTNIVPGGRWHKEASLFLKKDDLPSAEIINTKFPELIPILEKYPHVAKEFTGLKCPINLEDETLYVFDNTGEKLHKWGVDYFIQIFGLGKALDLINMLKTSSDPVFAWNRIWTKSKFERLDDVSKIPFRDFDILDFDFIRLVNNSMLNKEANCITCQYPDTKVHTEATLYFNSTEISLAYYYPNGNKKHLTNYFEAKLNGKCLMWHPNGQLEEEIDYLQNKCLGKKHYFPSGNIKMIENFKEDGSGKSVKTWYDNGHLFFESNEDGTSFTYSEKGEIISKSIRCGYLHKGGTLLAWEYSENCNIKKETKQYYIDGLLHGYEKTFYDSGELKREVDYTNGVDKKVVKSYKKNGEVTIK